VVNSPDDRTGGTNDGIGGVVNGPVVLVVGAVVGFRRPVVGSPSGGADRTENRTCGDEERRVDDVDDGAGDGAGDVDQTDGVPEGPVDSLNGTPADGAVDADWADHSSSGGSPDEAGDSLSDGSPDGADVSDEAPVGAAVDSDGASNADEAPDVAPADGAFDADMALARKMMWVWTGSCCTMDKAPIIKLPISVHTPQGDCRICLEDMTGERMVLLL
jgi:hypothetical protein